jgi:hypothetical protein
LNTCKETGKIDNEQWYDHVPKSVETRREVKVTILWNQQVQTDTIIANNKPDIMIGYSEKGACVLIEGEVSRNRNVLKKEAEKFLKCKYLIIKMQSVWNVKTKVIQY